MSRHILLADAHYIMDQKFIITIHRPLNTRVKHISPVGDINVNRITPVKILSTLRTECDTASDEQEAVERYMAAPLRGYDPI